MGASIRGHMGRFRILENGNPTKIIDITSVDISQDSSFSRTFYVGRPVAEGDQSIEGWSGSIELEVKDAYVDKFIDALINGNLNGIGVSDYAFVTTEFYSDGTSSDYLYNDCQFKMSRRQSGVNEKITKRLEFQASTRKNLNE